MKSSWRAFFCPKNLHILTMVTLTKVNTPALQLQGIPPTLSIQTLCFAVLSPWAREWPLHLFLPQTKARQPKMLTHGSFTSLISALTPERLTCWSGWGRCRFLLTTFSFFFFSLPLFPPSCISLILMSTCSHVHPFYYSLGHLIVKVEWRASLSVLQLILLHPESLGTLWAFPQTNLWWLKEWSPPSHSASNWPCWNILSLLSVTSITVSGDGRWGNLQPRHWWHNWKSRCLTVLSISDEYLIKQINDFLRVFMLQVI